MNQRPGPSGKAIGTLALVGILVCIITMMAPDTNVSAATREVAFLAADDDLRVSMRLTAEVDYPGSVRVEQAQQLDLVYDLEPIGCTISFVVPLDSLSFGLIPDETIEIALPVFPLGTVNINLLTFLTQVPSGLAELDLVIEGETAVSSCTCTDGTMWIETAASDVQWKEAGSRTIQVSASPGVETSTIRTALAYSVSLGLKAVALSADFWVFETTPLASTSGTSVLETSIETYEPSSVSTTMIGGVAVVGVVACIIGFSVLKRCE